MTVSGNLFEKVAIRRNFKRSNYSFVNSLHIGACLGFAIWDLGFLDRRFLCT